MRAWFGRVLKCHAGMLFLLAHSSSAAADGGMPTPDFRALVSRADLHYEHAVLRSEEGLPIGNGRVGTLLWSTPTAFKLQVNRVDVFASGAASTSFPERHTDYCGGCAAVEVDFGPAEAFPQQSTKSHLACYDGLASVFGQGVGIRALVCNAQDIIVLEITDERPEPSSISIHLRLLRPALVKTNAHRAVSRLEKRGSALLLHQVFTEGDFYCASSVGLALLGRRADVDKVQANDWRLVTAAGRGTFTVLISSAASFDQKKETVAAALEALDAVARQTFAQLATSSANQWHEFWSKSFVELHSKDGVAERVARDWAWYLYLMACTSRGDYPAKFNGMLWCTGGDARKWGSQFWGANQSCLYNNALFAANHPELMEPLFRMYSGMSDSCALAARQQWGSQGFYIPETVAFDGLAPLPEAIASEMRELYLLRKPWTERSAAFLEYASRRQPHSPRWNWMQGGRWENGHWIPGERGGGPYGPVTHIFSRGAKIAFQYWQGYEYTGDREWLRAKAYPMLSAVAEFYRNYPNLRKEADGLYHIHHVNSNESVWGAQDTDEEIAAMKGVLPVAIRASELLGVDSDKRELWRDLHSHLAPLPCSDLGTNASPAARQNATRTWIRGSEPAVRGNPSGRPDGNTMPAWFFELCTLESPPELLSTGQATFDAWYRDGLGAGRGVGVLSKLPLVAAMLGRAEAVRQLIPSQLDCRESPMLANRMDLREGFQTTSAQRLGNAADALHSALCQSLAGAPGEKPVIRLFPAWPKEWDARFKLRMRGGFLVSASMRQGQVEFVELSAQQGGECWLRNPWPERGASVRRAGQVPEALNAPLLKLPTTAGERILLLRARSSKLSDSAP